MQKTKNKLFFYLTTTCLLLSLLVPLSVTNKTFAFDNIGSYRVKNRYYEGSPTSYDWMNMEYPGKVKDTNTNNPNYVRDKAGDQKLSGSGEYDGRQVFCLIPSKMIFHNTLMKPYSLSEILAWHYYLSNSAADKMADQVSLIAYYGWEKSAKTDLDRVATQFLIWLTCGWQWDSSSSSLKPEMDSSVSKRISEIKEKVAKHGILPSFDKEVPELSLGQSYTFKDSNGVLSDYMKCNGFSPNKAKTMQDTELTWDGKNSLTIKPLAKKSSSVTITLPKVSSSMTGKPVAFFGDSQSITAARVANSAATRISYTLKPDGKIRFHKVDKDKRAIKGAIFSCASDREFKDTQEVTCDEHGLSNVYHANLNSTIYYKEIFVPAPYRLDPAVHQVKVDREEMEIEVENEVQQGEIKILKRDPVQDKPISGVEFALYSGDKVSEDKLVGTYKTDNKGEITIENLPLGIYQLVETNTVDGYVLDDRARTIQLLYDREVQTVTYTAQVENKLQSGEITLKKTSAGSKLPLAKARYRLTPIEFTYRDQDGSDFPEYWETVTNSDGEAIFSDLPLGSYRLQEIEAPSGYVLDTEVYDLKLEYAGQTISIAKESITLSNQPQLAKLQISKYSNSDIPLAEAEFELTFLEADYPEEIGTFKIGNSIKTTTDGDGLAEFNDLPLGHYKLREIKAPIGYILDPEERHIHLAYAGQTNKIAVYSDKLYNRPQVAQLIVHKHAENTRLPLPNTTFAVKLIEAYTAEPTDWVADETVVEITTDENGVAKLDDLPLGKYSLREISASKNMVLDDTEYEIDLAYAGQTVEVSTKTVELENRYQLATIQLQKNDAVTGVGLANAHFDIIVEEFFSDYTAGYNIEDTITTICTDEHGYAESEPLPLGRYRLVEKQAPIGYVLSDETIILDLKYGEQSSAIVSYATTTTNRVQRASLIVQKHDHRHQPLSGATFTLEAIEYYNEQDQPYSLHTPFSEQTVDDDGVIVFDDLPLGRYLLKEIKAPYGYLPHLDMVIDLPYAGQEQKLSLNSLIVTDRPQRGKIQLNKVDCNNDKPLAGAEFELIVEQLLDERDHEEHAPGSIITTLVTDTSGFATSEELPLGKYILHEKKPPAGYLPMEDLKIEINYAGQAHELSLISQKIGNQPSKTIFKKVDAVTGQVLSGAAFELLDSSGEVVHRWLSGNEPEVIFGLHLNEIYKIREVSAPRGYQKAEDQNLKITSGENTFILKNKQIPIQEKPEPPLPKTGSAQSHLWWLWTSGALGLLIVLRITFAINRQLCSEDASVHR